MSETQLFEDAVRMERGYFPDVPLHVQPSVGDGAIDGENVMFSRYSEMRSWRGFSPYNSIGAKLLHNAGGKIAGNDSGNVWKQHGNAYFFIGSGDTFVEDFTAKIGVSTSQLQVHINGQSYQAGLPKPSAPDLSISEDALGQSVAGQVSGEVSAQISRIRTVTGAESEASDTSNIINPTNGRIRVTFPAALDDQGQDEWGVYLTRHGFGGVGPHLLYRQIPEDEISPFAFARVAAGAGNGATTTFGGTTAAATNSRIAAIVLKDAAGVLPSFVASGFAVTAGGSQSIRVQRPVGSVDGQWMMVLLTFKATHTIVPAGANKGTDALSTVTGVWFDAPFPLDPKGEKIDVIQDSQTTFKWKLRSSAVYSASTPLSTSSTVLGSTGLAIKWTAASTSALEVGNSFVIDIFALVAPDALPLIEWQNNTESLIGIGVYGGFLSSSIGEFLEWTASQNSQMNALAVVFADVHPTTPVTQSFSNAYIAATSHTTTLPSGAPTATQLVTAWFTSDGEVADFTPTAPLVTVTDTDLQPRFVDVDYADDDLLDIQAPRGIEGPPAGTHGFPLGPITVIAGALDGTALIPSKPNQPEQYDPGLEATFLNPPEPIVRLEQNPFDGSIYIWTRNSLQTVVYTGDEVQPVLPRTLWSNTGIEGQSAACISKSGAYAFSGRRGICRYRGNLEPDTGFADAVANHTLGWNPERVVVGYDPSLEAIVYGYDDEFLVYFETQGQWSTPLKISLWNALTDLGGGSFVGGALASDARIVSCLTLENRLYFVVQEGEDELKTYKIFQFDIGLGGDWFIRSVARHGNAQGFSKTLRHARLIADFSSIQPMEWYWQNSITQRGDYFFQTGTNVEGYAASRLYLAPSEIIKGKIRFEWTVHPTLSPSGEQYATFAAQDKLTKYGASPTLPVTAYNVNSKLGWRITFPYQLNWYDGATASFWGIVQAGDIIRVDFEGNGTVKGRVLRNGSVVGSVFSWSYTAATWTQGIWYGWKISVKTANTTPGNIHIGNVYKYGQTGGFRFYRNFGGERGLAEIVEKIYAEDDPHTYPWERLNKINIVTYNVEFFGSAGEQRPSVLYVDGRIPGRTHKSLLTQ